MSETLLQQFLTAFLSAQVFSALISVGGLGAIAYYGHRLVRQSAIENVAIAERKLFLDLIPKRSEWITGFVELTDELLAGIITSSDVEYFKVFAEIENKTCDLADMVETSAWLFGVEFYRLASSALDQVSSIVTLRRQIGKEANHSPALKAEGEKMTSIQVELMNRAVDYLFVGDIKRRPNPTKKVKAKITVTPEANKA